MVDVSVFLGANKTRAEADMKTLIDLETKLAQVSNHGANVIKFQKCDCNELLK